MLNCKINVESLSSSLHNNTNQAPYDNVRISLLSVIQQATNMNIYICVDVMCMSFITHFPYITETHILGTRKGTHTQKKKNSGCSIMRFLWPLQMLLAK
jgi:hypothetical protein